MPNNKPKPQFIRPIVICIFSHKGKILACEGTDSIKNEVFYRPAGGMIEFGEKSEEALKREIMEEIGEEIKNVKYLGMLENIFTYEGKDGHEIVLVYDAEFVNEEIYEKEVVEINETVDVWYRAYWISLDEFGDGKLKLYPDNLREMLTSSDKNLLTPAMPKIC